MGHTNERNSNVERIRVIACIFVIWNHVQSVSIVDAGNFRVDQALIYSVMEVHVPLFLIITGFFLFRKVDKNGYEGLMNEYLIKIIHFIGKIFIPALIVIAFSAIFYQFIVNGDTIADVFRKREFHWEFLKDFVFKQEPGHICVHFWYVWTYAQIIVFFPLLAGICQNSFERVKIRRFFELISLLNILFVDAQNFIGKSLGDFDGYALNRNILFVLLGFEIYSIVKEHTVNIRKLKHYGLLMIFTGIACKILLQYLHYKMFNQVYSPMAITIPISVGAFLVLYALKESKHSQIWNWLGQYTLYIYMVHVAVIYVCNRAWYQHIWLICGEGKNIVSLLFFDVIYGFVVFGISLFVAIIFKVIYEEVIEKPIIKLVDRVRKVADEKNRIVGNTSSE